MCVLTTALGGRSSYDNLPHITDKKAEDSRDGLISHVTWKEASIWPILYPWLFLFCLMAS